MYLVGFLSVIAFSAWASALDVEPGSLRVDGTANPIAVDSVTPQLSWRLQSAKRGDTQTAYQIQAAGSEGNWSTPDVWDSGWVELSDNFATYAGRKLESRSAVSWRVRVWDSNNETSPWSDASRFEVSLLDASDWEAASWITNPAFASGTNSLPMFATEFNVACAEVSRARLYLLGLGVHSAEVNGQPVDDDAVLAPGYSTVNRTLPYSVYDVTQHLAARNALGVALGKGIYDTDTPIGGRYTKVNHDPQPLLLIARLEYACAGDEDGDAAGGGVVVSDGSWLTTVEGPYLEAHWYGGEEYDARREIEGWSTTAVDRQNWTKATVTDGPGGVLISPRSPPLRRHETITAVSVQEGGDQWVFDLGINIAGTYAFKINGTGLSGTRITFWPAERLTSSGAIDQSTTGSKIYDAYTIKGEPDEVYSPKFMYHGMQYIGINLTIGDNLTWAPAPGDLNATVIRASLEPVLTVATSSQLFNKIHENIDRSIQGNMYSVLTDCPHREKLGWLEQDHLVFDPVALGYDIQAYGFDLVRTIADAQATDVPGLIPDIAPENALFSGGYRTDPNWGSAIIRIPILHYQYYGDIDILTTRYTVMTQYLDYLRGRADESTYLDDGGLGDWETFDSTTPKGATSTFAYYQAADTMALIELLLGNDTKAAEYQDLASSIQQGYHSKWFNSTDFPHYCQNSQACNAMALDMGAVPDEFQDAVLSAIVASLEAQSWHWDVGEIGLPSLIRVLRKAGRDDILFELFSQETIPSYGSQVALGATTLWEHWDAPTTGGSLNHFMFGYGDLWILQLSGLAQSNGSVAWWQIDYSPVITGNLTSASSSYRTPRGVASANWSLQESGLLDYQIVVPVGATGTVTLNSTSVTLDGGAIGVGQDGVKTLQTRGGQTVIEVGSGSYLFSAVMG